MASPVKAPLANDDVSRQRRKREARFYRQVAGVPGLSVADVVADVLAASDEGRTALDVPGCLAERGHTGSTIEIVVAYLQGQRPPVRLAGPSERPRP